MLTNGVYCSLHIMLLLITKPALARVVSGDRKTRQRRSSFQKFKDNAQGRTYVDHTYVDHLHEPHDIPKTISVTDLASKHIAKGPRGGVSVAFPLKLHQMLTTVEEEHLEHIVSWQSHGRCFLVHDKKRFVDEIMPRFFHQSKMTSFQRQLNLYGFNRLTVGKDRGAYYHEYFLRQREFLCERMNRTRIKGNGMKAVPSPSTEPDFYKMTPCPPLCAKDDPIRSLNLPMEPLNTTSLASLFRYQPRASILCTVSDPPSPTRSDQQLVIESHIETINRCLNSHRMLRNGDLAFFEGQQFRYLELSDDEESVAHDGPESGILMEEI